MSPRLEPSRTLVLALLSFAVLTTGTLLPAQEAKPTKKAKAAAAKKAPNPAYAAIEDQPGLPRVLLLGDSISIGYTLAVREELKGKANVHRPATNCGPTTNGLANLDKWLGDKPWDVIHFNWGLHDLKYMDDRGALVAPDAPGAKQQVPPEQYEKNLRELVARLKRTKAKLVWCATTPVPTGAAGRVADDSVKYNEIAARVMKDNGVETNDLHAFAKSQLAEIQLPANVHFSPNGSKTLARQVAEAIQKALPAGK